MQIRHISATWILADFRGLLVSDSKYFKEKHSAKKPLLAIISSFWFAKILGLKCKVLDHRIWGNNLSGADKGMRKHI